jgi:uncharacterized protein YecT (DUF1311 family)
MGRALFLALIVATGHVNAAEKLRQECEGPDTSSRHEGCVLGREMDEMQSEIRDLLRSLSELLDNEQQRAGLAESERAWTRYRDSTCKFEEESFGGINSIRWTRCNYRLTKERLDYLRDL